MFNPQNPTHVQRLGDAVTWSRRQMEPFRRNRYAIWEQYVGQHFSASGSGKRIPVNIQYLASNIYLRQLVSRAPRAMVTARDPQLKPVASDMQAWLDRAAVGMRLLEALSTCVQNSLAMIGVMKIGVAKVGEIDIQGVTQVVGQPYALPVSFDDFVCDMRATRYEYCKYAGNRYPVSLEEAKNDPAFDKDARESLQATPNRTYNEMGEPRASALSQGTEQGEQGDYEDVCELWDVWLPRERLLVTLASQDSSDGGFSGKPLRVVEWQGPTAGPYRVLSLCDVPDSIMSPAPLQSLMDMHLLLNDVWRKIARQATRAKKISTFRGGAKEDQANINRADDGDAVLVNFPEQLQEAVIGGMDPQTVAFAEQMRNITSWLAGNLDTMGGLSPQAQTLGQEELLAKSSSAQIASMQDRTVAFTRDVMTDLAFWWWHDPILYYTATKRAASGDEVPVSITPQMRQIPFDRLDWQIDPYTMQSETPASRLSGFLQILQQTLMPLMPMLAQQGYSLKGDAIVEIIGRYGNYPDLKDVLQQGPPPDQMAGQQIANDAKQEATKPPATTRTNVRINRPGVTNQGQSQIMQQLAMGMKGPNGQHTGQG